MNTIKNSLFVFSLSFFISFLSENLIAQAVEEIVVKGDWREISINQEDSSIVVLDDDLIKSQAMKHFEHLSYLCQI